MTLGLEDSWEKNRKFQQFQYDYSRGNFGKISRDIVEAMISGQGQRYPTNYHMESCNYVIYQIYDENNTTLIDSSYLD
jgi:hypothetical protein